MPRQWTKLLMQPFYPGMGNRSTVDCPGLPGPSLRSLKKIGDDVAADEADLEKRAWQDYFDGIGPKPDANAGNS